MKIHFFKFHGNGNDFILIDNRTANLNLNCEQIQKICDRRFGIGADGLLLLNNSLEYDFMMKYYNSDGKVGSMCGNGGRCISAFAKCLGIVSNNMVFEAIDGIHKAIILSEDLNSNIWDIRLSLADVIDVDMADDYYFLNTGSPHYVEFVDKVAEFDVVKEGAKTRYSEKFAPEGTNVNFVEKTENGIFVRTYERGVENETLSCGTGVTASSIAFFYESGEKNINVHTIGGDFNVEFSSNIINDAYKFEDVWLRGPATLVFEGEIFIN